jgi:hypothetical protein
MRCQHRVARIVCRKVTAPINVIAAAACTLDLRPCFQMLRLQEQRRSLVQRVQCRSDPDLRAVSR